MILSPFEVQNIGNQEVINGEEKQYLSVDRLLAPGSVEISIPNYFTAHISKENYQSFIREILIPPKFSEYRLIEPSEYVHHVSNNVINEVKKMIEEKGGMVLELEELKKDNNFDNTRKNVNNTMERSKAMLELQSIQEIVEHLAEGCKKLETCFYSKRWNARMCQIKTSIEKLDLEIKEFIKKNPIQTQGVSQPQREEKNSEKNYDRKKLRELRQKLQSIMNLWSEMEGVWGLRDNQDYSKFISAAALFQEKVCADSQGLDEENERLKQEITRTQAQLALLQPSKDSKDTNESSIANLTGQLTEARKNRDELSRQNATLNVTYGRFFTLASFIRDKAPYEILQKAVADIVPPSIEQKKS